MEKVGTSLGKELGDVLSVDTRNRGFPWERWLKVRVLTMVSKPLVLGCWLNIAGDAKIWVTYKYEKLPNICFVCGCLDHMEADCPVVVASQLKQQEPVRKYAKGVRADGLKAPEKWIDLFPRGYEGVLRSRPAQNMEHSLSSTTVSSQKQRDQQEIVSSKDKIDLDYDIMSQKQHTLQHGSSVQKKVESDHGIASEQQIPQQDYSSSINSKELDRETILQNLEKLNNDGLGSSCSAKKYMNILKRMEERDIVKEVVTKLLMISFLMIHYPRRSARLVLVSIFKRILTIWWREILSLSLSVGKLWMGNLLMKLTELPLLFCGLSLMIRSLLKFQLGSN